MSTGVHPTSRPHGQRYSPKRMEKGGHNKNIVPEPNKDRAAGTLAPDTGTQLREIQDKFADYSF